MEIHDLSKQRALYVRGMNEEVLKLLASEPLQPPSGELAVQEAQIRRSGLRVLAQISRRRSGSLAKQSGCAQFPLSRMRGRGECARQVWKWNVVTTRKRRASSSVFSPQLASSGDRILGSERLLDLSWSADEQTHFDEALDWADWRLPDFYGRGLCRYRTDSARQHGVGLSTSSAILKRPKRCSPRPRTRRRNSAT